METKIYLAYIDMAKKIIIVGIISCVAYSYRCPIIEAINQNKNTCDKVKTEYNNVLLLPCQPCQCLNQKNSQSNNCLKKTFMCNTSANARHTRNCNKVIVKQKGGKDGFKQQ